jgi:hypothetical protein
MVTELNKKSDLYNKKVTTITYTYTYTHAGGFAYKEVKAGQTQCQYWYFPVIPLQLLKYKLKPKVWESPVHIPEYNKYLKESQSKSDTQSDKYAPDVSSLAFGDRALAALGLSSFLGIPEKDLSALYGDDDDGGVAAIQNEIQNGGGIEDKKNLEYVLKVSFVSCKTLKLCTCLNVCV